jgi:hypothetical protein
MSDRAPLPAASYAVGIVGHRADRIGDAARVSMRLREVLDLVAAALPGDAALRLVSALAEGADRLGASAALEAGMELDAVLPFPVDEYARDFAGEPSRAEFADLLARASSTLILDGAADARARAYEAAGMALLDNCDLLIAVWDGGPSGGRGGTRDVIEEAIRRGIPLAVVAPDGTTATMRVGDARRSHLEDLPERPLSALPGLIAGMAPAFVQDAQWRDFATRPPKPLVHAAYPLLLKCAGGGSRRGRKAEARAAEPERGPLSEAFQWWDRAAVEAAQAFRSAVIVNFALAALAIVLAATSVLGGPHKWLFVLAEILTILALLANALSAGRRRWHERWLESREVAELLRVATMLRQTGIGRGIVAGQDGSWIGRYAAAFTRASPPVSADLSNVAEAAGPLVADVAGQAAWNAATARRMHRVAHRIERFGEVLFGIVLLAAVGWLWLHFAAPRLAHDLQFPLTAVTAGLPAIATASYGIRVILDFEGIAARALRMSSGFEDQLARWRAGPKTAAALQDFARRAADIMLSDVAAWRLLAEGRRLTIPG